MIQIDIPENHPELIPPKFVEVPACPKAEERTSASSGMAGYLTLPLLQIREKIKDNKKRNMSCNRKGVFKID